jgi:hypothetical protein
VGHAWVWTHMGFKARPGDWTPEEVALLFSLAKEQVSALRAARILGRRVSAVRRRARQMRIVLYKDESSSRFCRKRFRRPSGEHSRGQQIRPLKFDGTF